MDDFTAGIQRQQGNLREHIARLKSFTPEFSSNVLKLRFPDEELTTGELVAMLGQHCADLASYAASLTTDADSLTKSATDHIC